MKEKELDTIINLIPTATYDQVKTLYGQLKIHTDLLNRKNINKFKVKDQVKFKSNGKYIEGTIEKVKVKRITIKTNQGNWDVPANMIKFVARNACV